MMKFLFVHQNFPGQHLHVVRRLHQAGHTIRFITQRRDREIEGVQTLEYVPLPVSTGVHPHLLEIESNMMNGLAVARICEGLKQDGFTPDIIIGHTGWGELLFVKDVWPNVPFLGYFEFFYRFSGADLEFDPEFPPVPDDAPRIRMRNTNNLLCLDAADRGYTPTKWQRDTYPADYHHKITVIHEGVDTDLVKPDETAMLWLRSGALSRQDQVLTYSVRNLEPYRGFHVFMRALPAVLERCPKLRVVIVGGDAISYGRPPPQGCWREHMLAEVGSRLDLNRVHFVGWLPYEQYRAVLNVSSAHVYLTYPFVLSWGLIEAMASECCIIASRTPPVEEVIDGKNGHLVDFFDREALADRICSVIENPQEAIPMRRRARRDAIERFDLKRVTLPAHLAMIREVSGIDPAPAVRSRRSAVSRPALAGAR